MFLVDLMIAVVVVGLTAITSIAFLASADATRRIKYAAATGRTDYKR